MNFIKGLPSIERMPNGSLPTMTPTQRKQANALIRKNCCHYDGGNCVLLDKGERCVCVQSISYSVNCKYFRHVLLKDKDGRSLEAAIFQDDVTKRCCICGKAFQPKSQNAKYCTDCAKAVLRKQKAEHIRKRRSSVDKDDDSPLTSPTPRN